MPSIFRIKSSIALAFFLLWGQAALGEPSLVKPSFLFDYTSKYFFYDYRPAVNAAGTRIVFERTYPLPSGSKPVSDPVAPGYRGEIDLYIASLSAMAATVQRLVPSHFGTNRPDWCWLTSNPSIDGPITFSTASSTLTGIYYTSSRPQPGGGITSVPKTTSGMVYPTWYPGCGQLAVYVNDAIAYQGHSGPELEKFKLDGSPPSSLSGQTLWAGFGSVNSQTPGLLAVAAQQFNVSNDGYQQDMNYVYISNTTGSTPRIMPLDPQAPTNVYDGRYEGRAPTWSPDGRWIAFESNRYCRNPNGLFAIFLQDATGQHPARQVTDCSYNTQHAKWFRLPVNGRTLLVVSARPFPGISGPTAMQNAMGVATLDITSFVTAP